MTATSNSNYNEFNGQNNNFTCEANSLVHFFDLHCMNTKQCLFKIVVAKQGELWVMWARHLTLTMPHSTQLYKWQTLILLHYIHMWYVTVLFILQRIVHLYDVFEIGQHS